ncbi:MAG TPA: hypothetical protein VEU30_07100, partial [Thermoanaerobaculia bacterium]|nr:hypothetical protein [Thermoanaerobaculia bacterium]
ILTLRAGTGGQKTAFIRYNSDDATPAYWDVGIRGNNTYQIFDGNAALARMVIDTTGRVGFGTGTGGPLDKIHIEGTTASVRLTHTDSASTLNMIGFYEGLNLYGFVNQRGSTSPTQPGQFNIGNNHASGIMALWAGSGQRLLILANGDVGIGMTPSSGVKLHVAGNIVATGSVSATYQDVAEWVPATTDMAPGTVVVLNPSKDNEVMLSTRAYDTTVAGVVSAQPGIILGVEGAAKEQVATTGRVRVRVDATAGPVKIGDLLVTSNKPGMAMRSEAMEINGRSFHQPGTIIGKALEGLASGEGEILVLLSMQ